MNNNDVRRLDDLGRYAIFKQKEFMESKNKMNSQSRYCYECGKTMKLIQNSHGSHWQCDCGHELPEKAKDRPVMKSSGWNKDYIASLREAGFMAKKED